MDIINQIFGYLAAFLGGRALSKAGNERNWVRLWQAVILFIFGWFLLNIN